MIIVLLFCLSAVTAVPFPKKDDTLVLMHVILRHGDRTPNPSEAYPNDPYGSEIYYPQGMGQLTNAGKRREFDIGQALRLKYNNFLGEYKSTRVMPMSTDFVRTKMSCLLVLAGLYPPGEKDAWDFGFKWQPIPYNYNNIDNDTLLGYPHYVCPKFMEAYDNYMKKENGRIYRKNKKLYDFVSYHTGLKVEAPSHMRELQLLLNSQEEMGFELPLWTKKVWPENITRVAVEEYHVTFATPQMKRLAAGPLLNKIINDTKSKISNSTDETRIYIYSAHENNIAYQLILFNAFYPHIPSYGSYLVIEVHKIMDVYGLKIWYENYTEKSGYIDIAKCGTFCPFDIFLELMKDNLPTEEDVC